MQDRVAIVTGGTRGIGRSISSRLARAGLTPVMIYRSDEESAREALAEVKEQAPRARVMKVDLTQQEAVERAVFEVLSDQGRIDVLVNNAFSSTGAAKKVHELALEAWEEGLRSNLTGPFLITRACLPAMVEQKHGRIVFVGSLALRGEPGRAIYSTAKNAQIGLMKTIAREYAREGITANMVSPGYIEAGGFLRLDEAVRERAARTVPSRRLGTAEEVAEAVLYFAGEASGYTTAQILGVDGAAP